MIPSTKIRLILGCCLLLVLFSSCRPRGVLSREKMANVLFDIHLTEAAVSESNMPIPETWTRGMETAYFKDMAYRSVLRKHHLTQEEFYISVSWYSKHMNVYEKVYVDVQKKMDDFRIAVDLGQFDPIRSFKFGADSAKILALYSFGPYRIDLISANYTCLPADSFPSYTNWFIKKWLTKTPKDTTNWSIYPQLSVHSVSNTSDQDSLRKMADSLIRQNPVQAPINRNEILAPGARRLPTRNFREVPQNEQIRKRLLPRAIEQEQSKRMEAERLRREKIEANKKIEPNHWK